jgi:hypothetical protein
VAVSTSSEPSGHPAGCSCCQAPLDPDDFDIRSEYPDPILQLSEEERAALWGGRNMIRADGIGAFVRCLMPVRLVGGGRITYSAWLSVEREDLRHAHSVWREPAYADLTLAGTIANAIQPWPGIFGEPATAEVRDADSLPYLAGAEGTLLWRVLNEEWDRDEVLSVIWHALPATINQRVTDDWSVRRTASLVPRVRDGVMRLVGPGRTVQLDILNIAGGRTPEQSVEMVTEGAPEVRDGEITETIEGVLRHAFWLRARSHFELYGYAALPGTIACVICMYDDPADLTWATETWRSLAHHPAAGQDSSST